MGYKKDREIDNLRKAIRDWLTIFVLGLSLLGVLYSAWLKPQSNFSDLSSDLRALKIELVYLKDDVKWIKSKMR